MSQYVAVFLHLFDAKHVLQNRLFVYLLLVVNMCCLVNSRDFMKYLANTYHVICHSDIIFHHQ
jgi:hypothetical protein